MYKSHSHTLLPMQRRPQSPVRLWAEPSPGTARCNHLKRQGVLPLTSTEVFACFTAPIWPLGRYRRRFAPSTCPSWACLTLLSPDRTPGNCTLWAPNARPLSCPASKPSSKSLSECRPPGICISLANIFDCSVESQMRAILAERGWKAPKRPVDKRILECPKTASQYMAPPQGHWESCHDIKLCWHALYVRGTDAHRTVCT